MILNTALLLIFAATEVIQATDPEKSEERLSRFIRRNSPECIHELADELSKSIDLDAVGIAEGFTAYYRKGEYIEALDAYRDYVINKLRDPVQYGIPGMCVTRTDGKAFDRNLQFPSAVELMKNIVTVRNLKVNIGKPGTINWTFIPPGWEHTELPPGKLDTPDDHTGDVAILPRSIAWHRKPSDFARHFRQPSCFNALLNAYCETGEKAYLDKWSEYIDDWCMNQKADADASPYNILLYLPQEIERWDYFVGNIAYVASKRESFASDLPSSTIVRLLLRRLPEAVGASIRQLSYFDANWRWLIARRLITNGLLFREFRLSEIAIREGRRGEEISDVVCILPDGTDYELTPNYWGAYLEWCTPDLYRLAKTGLLSWMTPEWIDDLQHSAWLRERAILGVLMPNGRWPLIGPQDLRSQYNEYDRAAVNEVIPDFMDQEDNAHILNRVFGDTIVARRGRLLGDGKDAPISYTAEWLPYGGFYFLRGGWDSDDHFAFMKSSGQVVGHGGPLGLWQNNNAASLYAHGEELLFVHHETPLTVDGNQQNIRFGMPFSGHIGYLLPTPAQPIPANNRWHSSELLDFAEGLYEGPYGKPVEDLRSLLLGECPPSQINDVSHLRQIIYLKKQGFWIVTDRLNSEYEHDYDQLWLLHIPEESSYGPIHGFTEDQIRLDQDRKSLCTEHPQGPNVSLYQFGTAPLDMRLRVAPPNAIGVESWTTSGRDPQYIERENYLFSFTISRINTSFRGSGNQAIVSLVYPERITEVSEIREPNGVIGFNLSSKDGSSVIYRISSGRQDVLEHGDIRATGEAMLLVRSEGAIMGIALGCKQFFIDGKDTGMSGDFEFAYEPPVLQTSPIHTPIAPVQILPDISIFTDRLDIEMRCATPDEKIHYTLDGEDPTLDSPEYKDTITITDTALVQARAFRKAEGNTYTGIDFTQAARARFTKEILMEPEYPEDITNGLSYEYYEGEWQKLLLLLDTMKPFKTGNVEHLMDISAKEPNLFYAFIYKGWIEADRDGVYTFYSPEPVFDPSIPNLDQGYYLSVRVGGKEWYPGTRRHSFGKWSVALKKGFYPFEVAYIDFREGKEDIYFPNKEYECVWQGDKPEISISGPGLEKQPIPSGMLWRKSSE